MIPPVHIDTAPDEDAPEGGDRRLTVNRANSSDDNVVISFDAVPGRRRDAIGIPPEDAITFATALLAAALEVRR